MDSVLAFYFYTWSEPYNYREYTKEELMNPEKVEELFSYCSILQAYIKAAGWRFLIDYYGYEKLFEIDKRSLWIDEDTLEEYIESVEVMISEQAEHNE